MKKIVWISVLLVILAIIIYYNLRTERIVILTDTEEAYTCEGAFNAVGVPCSNAVDENWTTYTESFGAVHSYIYENYTKPTGTTAVNWTFKYDFPITSMYPIYVSYWNYSSNNWQELFNAQFGANVTTTRRISSDGFTNSPLQIKTKISQIQEGLSPRYFEGLAEWFCLKK